MTVSLKPRWIAAGLFEFWSEQFPAEIPTIYPDSRKDAGSLTEWVELWVQSWIRKPHRSASPPLFDVAVIAHVFVRSSPNTSRILQISEAATAALTNQAIGIVDVDSSEQPPRGLMRLREPSVTLLTRRDADLERPLLQHTVISWSGLAQPLDVH